ncbi:MAG: hypothetical protein J6I80_00845, partial [Clostridia bacterium]|nr:hypothetical protein [Clostridia bacterium]
EDMVTSYTFAMDLTQIPIPERLADLVYMLPGADMENASAWNFLLQLAERISVLTEVTPVLRFDPNVTVDYSGLKIMNEYFSLTSTSFDEATNTLTLKLNWIDQTKAIDPATANPLCLVSGIKLTPKENAAWDANKRMSVLHSGQISYNVFMRASALYSFAQKPENQEIYGLKPFVNPNLPSEAGASFGAIYKTFEDSYILAGALKNGWVNEDGKFAYYLDGKKVYGVKEIDGYYYDFGSKGLNDGQTKFTGLWLDESVNAYRYCKLGLIEAGWQMIGNDWYYFDTITQTAVTGVFNYTDEIVYELDVTGKLVKGFWAKTLYGLRYYYGPGFHSKGWKTIDGKDYFFENGVCLRDSIQLIRDNDNYDWYQFDETGACDKSYIIPDGFYTDRNGYGYSKDGKGYNTLTLIDGVYYYFNYMGYAQKGEYAGLLFGDDYKAFTGLVTKNGVIYYYDNGRTAGCGLYKLGDDYYYSYWGGVIKTGKQYASQSYCDLPAGEYEFGTDGKMIRGIIEKDGQLYYYENGKTGTYGLIKFGEDYYYVYWGGVVRTGKLYVGTTFCDLPAG